VSYDDRFKRWLVRFIVCVCVFSKIKLSDFWPLARCDGKRSVRSRVVCSHLQTDEKPRSKFNRQMALRSPIKDLPQSR
jgi:hypothetical protein